MAAKRTIRFDGGLADPELEHKLTALRLAPREPPPIFIAQPTAVMDPPAVIPPLRRMDQPFKDELIKRAIERQAQTGTMAGVPLALDPPDRKSPGPNPRYMPEPYEQGFSYDWGRDLFSIAPRLDSRMRNGAGYNRFAYTKGDAYIHTHPAWAAPEPGPEDVPGDTPMFIIHRDRITEIPARKQRR